MGVSAKRSRTRKNLCEEKLADAETAAGVAAVRAAELLEQAERQCAANASGPAFEALAAEASAAAMATTKTVDRLELAQRQLADFWETLPAAYHEVCGVLRLNSTSRSRQYPAYKYWIKTGWQEEEAWCLKLRAAEANQLTAAHVTITIRPLKGKGAVMPFPCRSP